MWQDSFNGVQVGQWHSSRMSSGADWSSPRTTIISSIIFSVSSTYSMCGWKPYQKAVWLKGFFFFSFCPQTLESSSSCGERIWVFFGFSQETEDPPVFEPVIAPPSISTSFPLSVVPTCSPSSGEDVWFVSLTWTNRACPFFFLLFLCLFLSVWSLQPYFIPQTLPTTPHSHSVLLVLFLPDWSFEQYISL